MAESECIFCRIVNGDIPCARVYEDDAVLAFLDLGPMTRGHTLVVPRKHCESLLDFPAEEAPALISALQKVGSAVHAGCRRAGVPCAAEQFSRCRADGVPSALACDPPYGGGRNGAVASGELQGRGNGGTGRRRCGPDVRPRWPGFCGRQAAGAECRRGSAARSSIRCKGCGPEERVLIMYNLKRQSALLRKKVFGRSTQS